MEGGVDAASEDPPGHDADAEPLHPADLCEAAFDAGLATPDGSIAMARACYSGPSATRNQGRCKDGQLVCTSTGQAVCVGEVLPAPAEACNDLDDDCDGLVDEDFDKATSRLHCGGCGVVCADDEACVTGTCQKRTETSCTNGVDDDGDGTTDCADSECEGLACGAGCTCSGGVRLETTCDDGADNDGDGAIDCVDPSCAGRSCGPGCTCSFTATKTESVCSDGVDNDGDGPADCADPDCDAMSCGTGCVCGAGARHETNCADGIDNDGDGAADCADPECNAKSCGTGCVCVGGSKRETDCADGIDNDGNNGADCMDQQDCPRGVRCRRGDGQPGTCQPDRTCE